MFKKYVMMISEIKVVAATERGGLIMGINIFGGASDNRPSLNLKKNQVLNLTKEAPELRNIIVGAGWDIATAGSDIDLDIAAFLLNERGIVQRIPEDVVYFGHKNAEGIYLDKDNRTGAGEGDDERIYVELDKLPTNVHKIVFSVTIHEAEEKRQTFGMVENSYIRLLDAERNEKELCIYNLKENSSMSTAVLFSELYREDGAWKYKIISESKVGDLNTLLGIYI